MKKHLLLLLLSILILFFTCNFTFSQNYVSRKQHRTNGENRYLLYHLRIYFTIRGDSIINTNRKRKKIYRTYVNDVVVENGDKREKWSIIEVDGVKKIQFIGRNTLTNNSWMIICDLILKED